MTVKVNGIDHSAIERFIIIVLLLAFSCVPCASAAKTKPNILLIVADDLGYGDLGCYGATRIKTPNIDRLAGSGVRFTDAHAPAAVCQPSRYAILSGTYFMRAQRQGQQTLYFHDGQVTLPGLLKSAGYRTAALGKWHLGFGRGAEPDYNAELKPGPLEVGFDSFFGCPRTHNEPPFVFVENHRVVGFDPADPIKIIAAKDIREGWGHGVSRGAQKAHAARPQERIDLILADKATQFISKKGESPFFLYLAFLAPHVPIAPAPEFQGTSQAANYGDFIQQLDACVGKVLDALKAQGLADNTLIFFTSDNGGLYIREPLAAGHRPNGTLLGQKTDAWEGGHRVPFIASWPGHIPAGSQCNRLLGLTDLMATIAAAAKVPMPAGAAPDSLNQLPALIAPATASAIRNEMLAQGTGGYALRQGDWAYLPKQGSSGFTVQVPSGPPWGLPYAKMGTTNSDIDNEGRIKPDAPKEQLYHLGNDLGQKRNLTLDQPERAEAMRARLKELIQKQRPASPSASLVELTREGQTAWRIFLPESGGTVERFACSELKRYVEKISGARFGGASEPGAPRTIQIGLRSALDATSGLPEPARGYDGYAISVRPERIVVAGDNPRGVLYGVYDLLERLGCRWYVQGLDPRDPEIVPRSPRPTLAAGSWAHASPIKFRICNASSLLFEIIPDRLLPQIDWAAKNRYNALSWQAHHAAGRVASEIQQMADCGGLNGMAARGLILHGPGHCFPFFLPSEKYFDEHPEWFGLKNGKRIKHGTELPLTNFCWSNGAACAEFIRNVEAFVAKWPQLKMLYMVGIDGGGICDCPNCQARSSSDLVIDLFNRLSDRLAEVAPGVIVETVIGYGLMEKPPRAARSNGKWRGLYAHWGRNHRQSYGDPDYANKDNLEAWTKLFPQYTVCSYYAAASHQPFHSPPFLHAIEGDTKYLVARGTSGHLTLQYPHGFWWNYSFNLAAAGQHGYYYPSRLPREQLKDYAAACFGPAAGLVEEYLATLGDNENLETSYRAGRGEATPDDMQRLRRWQGLLQDAARAAAGDEIYTRRVAKLAEAMEFLLQLGLARSTVANAENILKSFKAGNAEHGEVVQTVSAARARIADLEARADRLGRTVPGIMDAQWVRDWTIKRTLSGPLDQVDREIKPAAAAPATASAPSAAE